jgi:very-short-patch-repair endonuclease
MHFGVNVESLGSRRPRSTLTGRFRLTRRSTRIGADNVPRVRTRIRATRWTPSLRAHGPVNVERAPPRSVRVDVDQAIHGRRRLGAGVTPALDVDRSVARLAARQDGVVARAQLLTMGVGPGQIDHRVARGRLWVVHRGVYAVGHDALPRRGILRAALLAAGPGAVLSHGTAAELWRLVPPKSPDVEVTTSGRVPRSRRGLIVHRARDLDHRQRDGLPVTTPLRTLRDLASTLPQSELQHAYTEALVQRLIRPQDVPARLDAAPTRSELERALLDALGAARLPRPHVNHAIGPYVVDFAWPEHRLVVETDGYAAHGHRAAFERDRARDAALQVQDYAVLRFTWRQVIRERLLVIARIAQVLALRAATPGLIRRHPDQGVELPS